MAKTQAQLRADRMPIEKVYMTEKPNKHLIERVRAHRAKLEGNLGMLKVMFDKFRRPDGSNDMLARHVVAWRDLYDITKSEIEHATAYIEGVASDASGSHINPYRGVVMETHNVD